MAIVRELLIRLGFQTDKKAINQTNQAITGFRTRFAFVAAAATYAFSKVANFFNDIAKATLDSNDLARSLGISLKELVQIQGAARQVGRLDFTQTGQALIRVQTLLTGFRAGADDTLAGIAQALKFEIDPNGGPAKAFDQILKGLANIENEARRIQIAELIFGPGLGVKISDLAKDFQKFKDAIPNFKEAGEDAQKALEPFEKYKDSINNLTEAWEKLTISLSLTVIPILTKVSEYLTSISDIYAGLFKGDDNLLAKGLKAGSKLLDPFFDYTGLSVVPEFFKNARENGFIQQLGRSVLDYAENREGYIPPSMQAAAANNAPIVMNTEFNIDIPLGTTEEVASYLSEDINAMFQKAADEYMRHIQNNNPVVE